MNHLKFNVIIVAFVLASTAAFVAGVLLPGTQALDARHEQIAKQVRDVAEMQRSLGSLGDLYARVLELHDRLSDFTRRLPADNKFAEFANEVAGHLDEAGVQGYSVQPMVPLRVEASRLPASMSLAANVRILPLEISFQSDFARTFAFLNRLEGLERLTHIEIFQVSNDELQPGRLSVRLVLHTYHNPEDAQPAAAKGGERS